MISAQRRAAPVARAERATPGTVNAAARSRLAVAALGAVGGLLVVAGGLAPWLSLYAGLEQLRGTSGLNGQIVVGLGAIVVAAASIYAVRGGVALRWVLGIGGFAILALGGWLGIGLLQTFAVVSADPLLVARLEPGLGISLIGGSLAFATLFARPDRRAPTYAPKPAMSASHIVLALAVALAGVVHLLLTPEHLDGSLPMGVGFLGAGVAQLIAAAFVLQSRRAAALRAVLAISLASLLALAAAVTVGLPFLAHGTAMGPLGPVEAVDDLAALTGMAELVAVLLSLRMLRSGSPRYVPQAT